MSRQSRLVLGSILALPLVIASPVAAKGFPNVKQLGKTVAAYQDELVKIVVSSRWSSKNLDSPWMILDLAV